MSKAREHAAAHVFFALGDRNRLALVRKLGSDGALSATVLSNGAKVTRQAIVKHLQVLESAGLVTHEKRGREVLYALEPRRLEEARAFLDGVSAGWDRAIDRLRQLVEQPEPATSTEKKGKKRREQRQDG